jgi:hypothetical protein
MDGDRVNFGNDILISRRKHHIYAVGHLPDNEVGGSRAALRGFNCGDDGTISYPPEEKEKSPNSNSLPR